MTSIITLSGFRCPMLGRIRWVLPAEAPSIVHRVTRLEDVAVALAVYATITTEAGWGVLSMSAATAGSLIALCAVLLGRVPSAWIIRGPFAFRPAILRPTAATYLISTFGQIILFWGFFLVVIPCAIAFLEQRWAVALPFPLFAGPVGVAALVLASALGLWSAVVMSTLGDGTPLPSAMPNRLFTAGPYRWIRNPMAVAGIVQGAAIGIILQSWVVVAYAVVGSLLWNYVVRPLEESDLKERFGEEFERYRDTVRCWIPQVSKTQRSPLVTEERGAPRVTGSRRLGNDRLREWL